jgi:hypothetical protein
MFVSQGPTGVAPGVLRKPTLEAVMFCAPAVSAYSSRPVASGVFGVGAVSGLLNEGPELPHSNRGASNRKGWRSGQRDQVERDIAVETKRRRVRQDWDAKRDDCDEPDHPHGTIFYVFRLF